MFQKTVSVPVLTDWSARNPFFPSIVRMFPLNWLSFQLMIIMAKPMFIPFVKIFFNKTCFTVHITHFAVNLTCFALVFNWNHLRWGFLIWELFFIYYGLFVLILVVFVLFPSGPVAQRIEALSLYSSRWALSEDSGFKSYPSRPEVYLVKNVVR